jgi:hypothetical protein
MKQTYLSTNTKNNLYARMTTGTSCVMLNTLPRVITVALAMPLEIHLIVATNTYAGLATWKMDS